MFREAKWLLYFSQNMLYVEIPPYRDSNIYHPAKVNFYVLNGKRKPSQPQHFTYMPFPGDRYSL